MIFPRDVIKVDKCIAVVIKIWPNKGKPKLHGNRVVYKNRLWKASRLSFHLNIQHIPLRPKSLKRGLILHRCNNGWCINPKHLYLGTFQQNMIDMYNDKGDYIKARISASNRRRICTEETRLKISNSNKGRKCSLACKIAVAYANKAPGRWTRKMREAQRQRMLGNQLGRRS